MGLKKEIRNDLKELLIKIDRLQAETSGKSMLIEELKYELRIQRAENQRLRDAFMAQDFEKFRTYTAIDMELPHDVVDRIVSQSELDSFAGEEVDGELASMLSYESDVNPPSEVEGQNK